MPAPPQTGQPLDLSEREAAALDAYATAHGLTPQQAATQLAQQILEQRYRIILAHRAATEARIAALRKELDHIDRKAAYYRAACAAGTEKGVGGCEPPCDGHANS